MSKRNQDISSSVATKENADVVGWEEAIAEAKRQIGAAEKRITKLRLTIETFEEFRSRGVPFGKSIKQSEAGK